MTEDAPNAPAPASAATPSPAATRAPAAPSAPTHVIAQHLLSDSGPSKVVLPGGSRPIDVLHIDGRFYLRTAEPIQHDDDTMELTLVPVALGTKFDLGDMVPVPMRSTGIHFFVSGL